MNEEEQAPPSDNVGYYQPPPPMSDESIKWQLNPNEVIEELEHYLRAEVLKNGAWVVCDKIKPLMNDEGVHSLSGILRNYLNKNVVLSNLSEDHIKEVMKDLCRTLRIFLVSNHRGFNISKKNFTQIYTNTENHIFIFLMRAKENGERRRWMQTQQIVEHKSQVEQLQPKKRFGLFN